MFRALEPDTSAAISSYCRADTQDIDWGAWNRSGFVFLPQAYVNDFGSAASPEVCAEGAAEFFPTNAVHPTVGVYTGQEGEPSPERYAALLAEARTVGFSVYLAETQHASLWSSFGDAIADLEIARPIRVTNPFSCDADKVDDLPLRIAPSSTLIPSPCPVALGGESAVP